MKPPEPTVDLSYPTEPYGRVPSFSNIDEEAEFWDTHDFTDFNAEFGPWRKTIGLVLAEEQAANGENA